MSLGKEKTLLLYKTMKLIRRFEETASNLFEEGKVPGFIHLCIGQEATAVGVCSNLREDDYITSTHRGHGHVIAKGGETCKVMAELFGRETGYCKGKGGSMHVADVGSGILGANGIVGGGLPIGVGAAVSAKIRGTDQVTVCFFGEGATSSGYFHEAMNMAAVLRLPIIFFCENNQYAEFTPMEKHVPVKKIVERAYAYGMRGITLDGNNVLEVYETIKQVVQDIRKEKYPVLIEALTYRWQGHYEGDRATYRPAEELKYWVEQRDPIKLYKQHLEQLGYGLDLEGLDDEVEKEIEHAVYFAENSPYPAVTETLSDVYA